MRYFLVLLGSVLSFITFAQNDYSMLIHKDNGIIVYNANLIDSVTFVKTDLLPDSLYSNAFDTEGTHNSSSIVVWGNSITWGSDATSSDKCYTAILRKLVKEYNNNFEVINCGVGGESCQSILVRQGAIGFYLGDSIVLPASSKEKIEVQRMTNYINDRRFKNTYFRDDSYFMLLV